ncbi:Hpt domain-containing protein [Psychrobacter sp.]|uniref:Hpt domain-containing protein n=1 Tax=Psychrobacter sp. TaxID=56811 RepID=UPI0025F5C3AC|nr:Hpt domain-containing protein [Psychrobacter sp.]
MSNQSKLKPSERPDENTSQPQDKDKVVISLSHRFHLQLNDEAKVETTAKATTEASTKANNETTSDANVKKTSEPNTDVIKNDIQLDQKPAEKVSPTSLITNNTADDSFLSQSLLIATIEKLELPNDEKEFDAEIKEIFVEEAEEVIDDISTQFAQLESLAHDESPLAIIRRGFHTLKGSGRMVGAHRSAELAWAIENMLNRVLDQTLVATSGIHQLLSDVISAYPDIIECYRQQTDYPESMKVWMAAATLYANKKHPEFDYNELTERDFDQYAAVKSYNIDFSPDNLDNLDSVDNSLTLSNDKELPSDQVLSYPSQTLEVSATKQIPVKSEIAATVTSVPLETFEQQDEELRQLFISEAKELIESIESMCQILLNRQKQLVDDELVRAFHTLRGAASSQSFDQLSHLSAKIENGLQRLQQKGETISAQHLQIINQSIKLIKYYLQGIEGVKLSHQCQDEIAQLELWLDNVIDEKSEFIEQATERNNLVQHIEDSSDYTDSDIKYTVAELIEGIDDLLDAEWDLSNIFAFAQDSADEFSTQQQKQVIDYAAKLQAQSQLLIPKVANSTPFIQLLTALNHAYQTIGKSAQLVQDAHVIDTLIAGHEQLTGLFDSLAGKMTLQLNQQAVQNLYAIEAIPEINEHFEDNDVNINDSVSVDVHDDTLQPQTQPQTNLSSNSLTDIETESEAEADKALLAIFIEEAQELAEESHQQLTLWQQDPDNVEPIKELQRHLHTLKGGARMAGVEGIAELCHEAETIYDYFASKQIIPTQAWVELMQSVQDVLSDQIEHLAAHKEAFRAPQMLQQLRSLADTKSLPENIATTKTHLEDFKANDSFESAKEEPGASHSKVVGSEGGLSVTTKAIPESVDFTKEEADKKESNVEENSIDQNSIEQNSIEQNSIEQNSIEQNSIVETEVKLESEVNASANVSSIELDFELIRSESWDGQVPDPDIMSVFLEEATELLPTIKSNYEQFKAQVVALKTAISRGDSDIDDADQISSILQSENETAINSLYLLAKQLQHELNLLYGGANMVQAYAAAEVIEALQKAYLKIEKKGENLEFTSLLVKPLHDAHLWIEQAVYLLQHGVNPPKAQALIKKLKTIDSADTILPKSKAKLDVTTDLGEYVQAIDRYQSWREARLGLRDISDMPSWLGQKLPSEEQSASQEQIRVPAKLMEQMIDLSGESAISRSRIELGMSSMDQTLDEMERTVQRLAEQLRRMDIELEAQIRSQIEDKHLQQDYSFDPLEMDQYSALNQLSKSLSESASDLLEIKSNLYSKTQGTESLLLQLAQSQTQLQEGLMTSRMVSFSRILPRLQRTVRQTASQLGKSVTLQVKTEHDEIDRTVLDRLTAPLEHMLRNSVDHGIELPEMRHNLGKPSEGNIIIEMEREGSEIVIRIKDDGQGIDVESVRNKAIGRGLIDVNDTSITDLEVMQYIFHAGLSTASSLTQISGRGVGMDVVLSEVRRLGGSVNVNSRSGQGSEFILRLPLTIAVAEALVVRSGNQVFAIPLLQIERVERIPAQLLLNFYYPQSMKSRQANLGNDKLFKIADEKYRLRHLEQLLNGEIPQSNLLASKSSWPVLLLKNQSGQHLALQIDEIIGSRREVVVKPLGDLLSSIPGLSAATVTAEGSVMLILDTLALMREATICETSALKSKNRQKHVKNQTLVTQQHVAKTWSKPQILIVDDSVTVRKVTSRLLQRQGYDTHVARDGVEAIEMLQTIRPDLMLLDIEMPRMDGFEVANHVRHNPKIMTLPIIMITSRTGEKHREKAQQIGVNDYMGKPFQEADLIHSIQALIDNKPGR